MFIFFPAFHHCMADLLVQEVTDREWEEQVEKNANPVFVMFYSPTCRHCIHMQPYIEELAKEFSENVRFVKVNIVRFGWLAERYGVMATPVFIYFCGGKPVQTRVGAVFPAILKKMIEEMVQHGEECRMRSTDIMYEITGYG
jgi:thioredoxin 1